MNSKYFYGVGKAIMFVACVLIVLYIAQKEMVRFVSNDDKSSVAIRTFHQKNGQDSLFPTFSLCFHGGNVMYRFKAFMEGQNEPINNLKRKIHNYTNLLEGLTPYNTKLIERFPEFSALTIDFKDLIQKYITRFDAKNDMVWDIDTLAQKGIRTNNRNWSFVVSYQTTRLICFTSKDEFSMHNKRHDEIIFNQQAMQALEFYDINVGSSWLYLYVHSHGQLIRTLDKPILSINNNNLAGTNEVAIKRVDVLRRRQNANIPCRIYTTSEDDEYLKTAIKEVGCVPVYWKLLNASKEHHPPCNSTQQYKTLHIAYNGQSPTPKRWVQVKWVPCYQMVVSSTYRQELARKKTGDLGFTSEFRIRIQYQDLGSEFFETVNTRDFGFESLWSSLGGIVGIFLGYSIIDVFEMISNLFAWIHDKLQKKT